MKKVIVAAVIVVGVVSIGAQAASLTQKIFHLLRQISWRMKPLKPVRKTIIR